MVPVLPDAGGQAGTFHRTGALLTHLLETLGANSAQEISLESARITTLTGRTGKFSLISSATGMPDLIRGSFYDNCSEG